MVEDIMWASPSRRRFRPRSVVERHRNVQQGAHFSSRNSGNENDRAVVRPVLAYHHVASSSSAVTSSPSHCSGGVTRTFQQTLIL